MARRDTEPDPIDRLRDEISEQTVLANVFLEPAAATYYLDTLEPSDFGVFSNRVALAAMQACTRRGIEPDFAAVCGELKDSGHLDDSITRAELAALIDGGVPRQPLKSQRTTCERLRQLAQAREMYYALGRAREELLTHPLALSNGFLAARRAELDAADHAIRVVADPDGRSVAARLMTDAELLSWPAPTYLVNGRIVAGSFVILVSESGLGKTTLATGLGFSIVTGRPWLGARVETTGPVVYIVAEGTSYYPQRVKAQKVALGLPLDDPSGFHVWPEAVNLMDTAAVDRFIAAAAAVHPVAVVVDTWARCFIGDENSARDVGVAIQNSDRIRRQLGAAVVWLHHTGKSGTTYRGSSALLGAVDTMLTLIGADDLLTLNCDKQKDAIPFDPLKLRRTDVPGTGAQVMRLAADVVSDDALTQQQKRALDALHDSFLSDGANHAEWLTAAGLPERSFYRAKAELVRRGYVVSRGNRFAAVETATCQ